MVSPRLPEFKRLCQRLEEAKKKAGRAETSDDDDDDDGELLSERMARYKKARSE